MGVRPSVPRPDQSSLCSPCASSVRCPCPVPRYVPSLPSLDPPPAPCVAWSRSLSPPRDSGEARAALTELHQQVLVGRQRLLEVALVQHQDVVLLVGVGARATERGQGQAEENAAQHVGSGSGASVGAAGQRGHESAPRPPRPYKPGCRPRARVRPRPIGQLRRGSPPPRSDWMSTPVPALDSEKLRRPPLPWPGIGREARACTLPQPLIGSRSRTFSPSTCDWRLSPTLSSGLEWPPPSEAGALRLPIGQAVRAPRAILRRTWQRGGIRSRGAGPRLRLRNPSCCILTGPRLRNWHRPRLGEPEAALTQLPARVRSVWLLPENRARARPVAGPAASGGAGKAETRRGGAWEDRGEGLRSWARELRFLGPSARAYAGRGGGREGWAGPT